MRSRNTRMDGEVRRWVRVCRTHTYPTYDKHEFKNHQDVRVETNRESRPIGSVRSAVARHTALLSTALSDIYVSQYMFAIANFTWYY